MRVARLLITLALLAAPIAPWAQQTGKPARVVVIHTTSPLGEVTGPDPVDPAAQAFIRGLRDLGYAEAKNLALVQLTARAEASATPSWWLRRSAARRMSSSRSGIS